MYFTEITFGSPLFDQSLELRDRLLRAPLGMQFEKIDIEQEWKQLHFGMLSSEHTLLATLTMKWVEENVLKMRQVAVDLPYQGFGIGKVLVEETEKWCLNNGIDLIILHARDTAVPFYKKLNYEIVGEPFLEVGILHNKMQKKIEN